MSATQIVAGAPMPFDFPINDPSRAGYTAFSVTTCPATSTTVRLTIRNTRIGLRQNRSGCQSLLDSHCNRTSDIGIINRLFAATAVLEVTTGCVSRALA
eukprot:3179591-Amphidinium_carterae.1